MSKKAKWAVFIISAVMALIVSFLSRRIEIGEFMHSHHYGFPQKFLVRYFHPSGETRGSHFSFMPLINNILLSWVWLRGILCIAKDIRNKFKSN